MPAITITEKNIISKVQVDPDKVTVFPGPPLESFLRAPFSVGYDGEIDLRELDHSILITPFLLNVAPLLWILGGNYRIDSMDEDLFRSLEKIRDGFRRMYPEIPWEGELIPHGLRKNSISENRGQSPSQVLFFSGGVDSTCSALHCEPEETVLLTIRGHDISLHNDNAWNAVRKQVNDFADIFHFRTRQVYANTFGLLRCGGIHAEYPQLKPWYGKVQHGIGLAGLAFPLAAYSGWDKILFSSSVGTQRKEYAWGSHLFLEPNLKVNGIQVDYTDADLIWTDKVTEIVSFYRRHPYLEKPFLRICLDEMSGNAVNNCGYCEKCLRGMLALMFNSEDPSEWGFHVPYDLEELKVLISGLEITEHRKPYWWNRFRKLIEHNMDLSYSPYSDFSLWFLEWSDSQNQKG